ncbi:hypothetical protein F5Y17DRAFT_414980 [Xylariaceae sp. FL0594]|nr:hypothetical protein F5Y17DRAFT_414980 [Xylariaceae sp. FL0594]
MDSARKIELQSPEDLAYLVENVRRAAKARIDEAFPPVDDGNTEDELRSRIEELVDEYITKTFTLAAPNISINGLPVDPSQITSSSSPNVTQQATEPEEIFEPFDARKRARVEALTAEEEDLLRDIAQLKKSVPRSVAGAWAEGLKKGVRDDESALESVNQTQTQTQTQAGGGGGGGSNRIEIKPLERQQDVEQTFERAVQGLARTKKDMPAVVARMERARKAGEYLVADR